MTTPVPSAHTSPARFVVRRARTDDPTEVDRLYEICRRTGKDGGDASALTTDPRLLGEVYLGPYLRFAPDLALVLVDTETNGPASVVGYVLGVADTATFETTLNAEWWPALMTRYPLDAFPDSSYEAGLVRAIHSPPRTDPQVLVNFPAHLHVDLLPAGQGGGHGRRLLTALIDLLREREVPGVHLGVSLTNVKAIGFYEHLGFRFLTEGGWQLGLDLRQA